MKAQQNSRISSLEEAVENALIQEFEEQGCQASWPEINAALLRVLSKFNDLALEEQADV